MVKSMRGFNLVELMIVIMIIAILAAIAQPLYQNYKVKTERTAAKVEMMEITSKLQRYKITNFSFIKNGTAVTLADINAPTVIPTDRTPLYDLSLTNITAGGWTLTATPKTGSFMQGDGDLVLNSRGQKCRTVAATCTPSATTSWDD